MLTTSGKFTLSYRCWNSYPFYSPVPMSLPETIPTTACIWNMATMKSHAIIVQQEPILAALWNPKISSLLAICCEGGRFYLWQDRRHGKHRSNITAINIPAGMCSKQKMLYSAMVDRALFWPPFVLFRELLDIHYQMESRWKIPAVDEQRHVLSGMARWQLRCTRPFTFNVTTLCNWQTHSS